VKISNTLSSLVIARRSRTLFPGLSSFSAPPALVSSVKLETNLPMGDLKTMIVMARRASRGSFSTEVLTPPGFALGWGDQHDGRGWVIIPNVEAMRAEIRTLLGD